MAINEHQCLHLSCAEATAENMVWVTHIYISNGGGGLEDRLVLRFISIPAFLQIIPLCDTY